MSLCGLRKRPSKHLSSQTTPNRLQKGRFKEDFNASGPSTSRHVQASHDITRPLTSHSNHSFDSTSHLHPTPHLHPNHPLSNAEISASSHFEHFEETRQPLLLKKSSANFHWAREDQLSVILEVSTESGSNFTRSRRGTPNWELEVQEKSNWEAEVAARDREREEKVPGFKRTRFKVGERSRIEENTCFVIGEGDYWEGFDQGSPLKNRSRQERDRQREWEYYDRERELDERERYWELERERDRERYSAAMSTGSERNRTPVTPRPIEPPPRDLESISRIDSSLVFEHFTTDDAWELGSALRARLLPIPTPVVIDISLANQNQTLFHTCTHSGVMPDNDSWVARKRKTVLRWGCSTWYMHCKFGGDEKAFGEKYGLGQKTGEYAIHGGGVPIRVTGVEGVVAVIVVSGLKQDEDHGVIVEVVRELYY